MAQVRTMTHSPGLNDRIHKIHYKRLIKSVCVATASALLLALAFSVFAASKVEAQETVFGKNKVAYRKFTWEYIQSEHFDIYYYDSQYTVAKFSASVLENAYKIIIKQLGYELHNRIPVFIYLSPNDFQTTSITSGILPEGVNGFTEAFKKRIVVHFNGSYADYRHLLHHELTHAVVYDMMFGSSLSSLISRQRLFNLPLWFAEGFAEYSSRNHWNYLSDMIVRDATINNYLRPPGFMGILAYTEGAMLINYIANKYGEDKLGEIIRKGKVMLSMDRAVKAALGVSMDKLFSDYTLMLKERYWPSIARRNTTVKIAKQLTKHGRDGSFYNEKPVFSPTGDEIAIFSDRSDYEEIYMISATDGQERRRITKASRTGDLESLHSYFSGITFSPDGDNICFVAKSNGYDALMFINVSKRKVYRKKEVFTNGMKANGLRSPRWSPDGKKIAFSALLDGQRDVFVYNLDTDVLHQITNDVHDDQDAPWMQDSKTLILSSDRPHPDNNPDRIERDPTGVYKDDDGSPLRFGAYNLFTLNTETGETEPIAVGEGNNGQPSVSPDGKKVCFISNRNGIDNIYLHYFDSTGSIAITDLLTGAGSPSWSPDGKEIAFSSFNQGGFDIFVMDEILPAGDNGVLTLSDYFAGKFEKGYVEPEVADTTIDTTILVWSPKTLGWLDTDSSSSGDSSSAALSDAGAAAGKSAGDTTGITDEGDFVFVSNKHPKDATATASTQGGTSPDSTTAGSGEGQADSTSVDSTGTGDSGDSDTDTDTDTDADGGPAPEDDPYSPYYQDKGDPLSGLLTDVPDDSSRLVGGQQGRAPDISVAGSRVGDEYVVKPYKVKFTPDLVTGGLNYDTFFGVRGQSFFVLSDYLGEHQIFLATDIVNTIDQSNVQAFYFNSTHRTRFGGGLFHSKNFYIENFPGSVNDRVFSDRIYGLTGSASHPFSTFSRIDLSASLTIIDRNYRSVVTTSVPGIPGLTSFFDPREPRSTKATTLSLSYTHDNVLWGLTGPINGSRSKLTVSVAQDFFSGETQRFLTDDNGNFLIDSVSTGANPEIFFATRTRKNLSYIAAEVDHRKYWHLFRSFSAAFRVSGGASFGSTPKRYFLGGTTNYITNRINNADVYEVENLYFSDVVTPLRGYDYYELSGTRYFLTNFEFRYPFIDYLQIHFPLPMALSRVQGVTFFDFGATWQGSDFRFTTTQDGPRRLADPKGGFGWGIRANLGFLLLRYDMAWATDFNSVADSPKSYFSFGADF